VTQEAFLRLLSEAQAGRYPDNPRAWLFRTSTNLAVSRIRRSTVARRHLPGLIRRDEPTGPEGIAVERERSEWMRGVLARLSPTERIALVMAAQGESGEAIAAHIGKSHNATRTLLFRARQRLRDALEAGEGAS
jgi:RNA polymerase sigma factor (sigma-70 family)